MVGVPGNRSLTASAGADVQGNGVKAEGLCPHPSLAGRGPDLVPSTGQDRVQPAGELQNGHSSGPLVKAEPSDGTGNGRWRQEAVVQ